MTDGEFVSKVTEEQRQAAIAEHRRQISSGEIPLGPFADQTDVIEDIRDKRDPVGLGAALLNRVHSVSILNEADYLDSPSGRLTILDYEGGFDDYMHERQIELETRAADGDRFAAALLRGETLAEDPVD